MDRSQDSGAIERELDTGTDDPSLEIARIVAELDGREIERLATIWGCLDGTLEHIFSNPPAPEAKITISFDYEGYRITVHQNGTARFEKLD